MHPKKFYVNPYFIGLLDSSSDKSVETTEIVHFQPQHVPCAQSCPTLWDPVDCNFPGSSFDGIFQARILEWNAISFSIGPSPHPGIKPVSPGSPALQADSLTAEPLGNSILVNN